MDPLLRSVRLASALGVVALLALATGCGDGDEQADPTTTTSAGPGGTAPADEAVWTAELIEPESGLDDVSPAPVIGVVETDDPLRPIVVFWAGTRGCYGLDRVSVTETDQEVRIEVLVGRAVPAETACIAVVNRYSARTELERPLDDRQILTAEAGGARS